MPYNIYFLAAFAAVDKTVSNRFIKKSYYIFASQCVSGERIFPENAEILFNTAANRKGGIVRMRSGQPCCSTAAKSILRRSRSLRHQHYAKASFPQTTEEYIQALTSKKPHEYKQQQTAPYTTKRNQPLGRTLYGERPKG